MQIDDTVAGCLNRIRRGDIAAIGVLADYLEEKGLTGAKTVRRYWSKYVEIVEWHADADFTRRKNTKWESLMKWRRWFRNRIKVLYKRKWKSLPLEKYK